MEINIKDQYGVTDKLPCSPADTVESLKQAYCQLKQDDPRVVELFWQRKYLVPTATLEGAKIHHGDVLFANRYQVQCRLAKARKYMWVQVQV